MALALRWTSTNINSRCCWQAWYLLEQLVEIEIRNDDAALALLAVRRGHARYRRCPSGGIGDTDDNIALSAQIAREIC